MKRHRVGITVVAGFLLVAGAYALGPSSTTDATPDTPIVDKQSSPVPKKILVTQCKNLVGLSDSVSVVPPKESIITKSKLGKATDDFHIQYRRFLKEMKKKGRLNAAALSVLQSRQDGLSAEWCENGAFAVKDDESWVAVVLNTPPSFRTFLKDLANPKGHIQAVDRNLAGNEIVPAYGVSIR